MQDSSAAGAGLFGCSGPGIFGPEDVQLVKTGKLAFELFRAARGAARRVSDAGDPLRHGIVTPPGQRRVEHPYRVDSLRD